MTFNIKITLEWKHTRLTKMFLLFLKRSVMRELRVSHAKKAVTVGVGTLNFTNTGALCMHRCPSCLQHMPHAPWQRAMGMWKPLVWGCLCYGCSFTIMPGPLWILDDQLCGKDFAHEADLWQALTDFLDIQFLLPGHCAAEGKSCWTQWGLF